MAQPVVSLAWYRFRTTLRPRWAGYLTVVLLLGLLGGVALGAVAAARRTQSSFSAYLASTNPSQLTGPTGVLNPLIGSNAGYDPNSVRTIARLPHVKRVESYSGLNLLPLDANGAPANTAAMPASAGGGSGSVDGLYFNQDRVSVTSGRMADPNRADEFVANAPAAQASGLHVGEVVLLGAYTNAQTELPGFGTASVPPFRRFRLRLVGIVVFNNAVVQDDVDASVSQTALFTPALTQQLLGCCVNYTTSGVQVEGGSGNIARVQNEIGNVLAKGFPPFQATSVIEAKAERAIRPESIALGVFGGIAGLAALLIVGQVIGRQLRLGVDDLDTLRALGAGPAATSSEGLLGIVGAVVVGSLLAAAVAVGLSPVAPLGPVRPVDPNPGVNVDWTTLGVGVLVLAVSLSAVAAGLAYHRAPHRVAQRRRVVGERASRHRGLGCDIGSADAGRDWDPIRPRARLRPELRTCALGHLRRGLGHDRRHQHGHIRSQPGQACLASGALRVELGL